MMKPLRILSFLMITIVAQILWSRSMASPFSPEAYRTYLNGRWQFKTDLYNVGEQEGWYKTGYKTEDWDDIEVPGNWDLKNEYADYVGKGWYRRTFDVPELWKSENVRLVFEAVYNDAQIWINGQFVGEHHVGFLPFWFDINSYLKFGEENTLVVVADNTFKRGAIWNWGGIRRPVWLEVTDKVRLEQQHITAIPDLEKGTANIAVEFEVSNAGNNTQTIGYDMTILREGEVVWSSPRSTKTKGIEVDSDTNAHEKVSFQLPKSKVDLWHFNFPNLYTCRLRIYQDGQVIHAMQDRFGIRKIEVDGYDFKLNGEPIRTVGFNLVAEDRTTGNTLPLWRIKEDVDLMKTLGANMARLSHLPLPEEFLDYLDEKGIMTFEEVSLWGKDIMVDPDHPLPKYWLEKMIQVKYNHPSVIGCSVGNEIGYTNRNPKVMEYVEGAIAHAKQLDPNRLAVYVSHSVSNQKNDPVKYADMILFNRYGNWGKEVEKAHELHPGKPIFMAEYGNHLNNEDPNLAYIDASEMLDPLRGKPYVIGASLWTFNDYRSFWKGSETWTTPPSQNRSWGIVNTFRQKKRSFYTFKREYAPVKSLKVQISGADNLEADITIEPRDKLDLPAYTLKDYKVVWRINNQEGKMIEGDFIVLPLMQPGDKIWQQHIRWQQPAQKIYNLTVELLDPQHYSVWDTTIYFATPRPPEIIKVHTSVDRARVVFNQVPEATSYKLVYGQHQESKPTINNFIEVGDLKGFTEYQFQIVALNNAGESQPSEAVKASTDEDELPPVIWATVPFEDHFFIGYSVDRLDYMYEIEYGTQPGQYDHRIGLRNVGVCQIPELKAGETYYYRMRNRKQWGFASEWTHEIRVDLPDEKEILPVTCKGVIRASDQAMLVFDPVDRAIGYKIHYRMQENHPWMIRNVNSAVISHAFIDHLKENEEYEFKIEAVMKENNREKLSSYE